LVDPLENLKEKWQLALKRAEDLAEKYPDPVQSMIDLFSQIPDDEDWQEIVEEPYG